MEKTIYISKVSNTIMLNEVMFPGIVVSFVPVYVHSVDQILIALSVFLAAFVKRKILSSRRLK